MWGFFYSIGQRFERIDYIYILLNIYIVVYKSVKQKTRQFCRVFYNQVNFIENQPLTLANLACLMLLILRSCKTFTASST